MHHSAHVHQPCSRDEFGCTVSSEAGVAEQARTVNRIMKLDHQPFGEPFGRREGLAVLFASIYFLKRMMSHTRHTKHTKLLDRQDVPSCRNRKKLRWTGADYMQCLTSCS